MSVIMACIDHHTADITQREKFAFTSKRAQQVMSVLKNETDIDGVILLCTCNRTELYLSCKESVDISPAELICREANISDLTVTDYFTVKRGKEAALHLMEVASGLQSEILGEDQIVSQVKVAADLARKVKSSNHELETLFRLAVTAAKKIKTEVRLKSVPTSAADRAICLLKEQPYSLKGKRALVIGNGEMGRISAALLVEQGCCVTITLRTYRHGETVVPYGCNTIDYDKRLTEMEKSDLVISATTSPHFTLTKAMMSELSKKPEYIIDLAVPRDIDPEISKMEAVHYFNIDTIGSGSDSAAKEEDDVLKKCHEIIEEHLRQYDDWLNMRECIPLIGEIKKIVLKRVNATRKFESQEEALDFAVNKTVDLMIYAMKDQLNLSLLKTVKEHMEP